MEGSEMRHLRPLKENCLGINFERLRITTESYSEY
jgi:hypothetical protein